MWGLLLILIKDAKMVGLKYEGCKDGKLGRKHEFWLFG